MRKIVNIRVNLPRPAMESWQKFLVQPVEHRTDTAMHWQQGLVAAVLLLCASAVVAQAMGWISGSSTTAGEPAGAMTDKVRHSENPITVNPTATANNPGDKISQLPGQTKLNQAGTGEEDRNRVGTLWSKRLSIGAASLMALTFLVIVFRRPKEPEKAMDSKDFVGALKGMAEYVYHRTRTPREMRRFLNYLRLVAAPDDPAKDHPGSIGEATLVRLAATGTRGTTESPEAVQLFEERCHMFGLDPQTFTPKDEKAEDAGTVDIQNGKNWKTAHPS